jgi:hypothetical protein
MTDETLTKSVVHDSINSWHDACQVFLAAVDPSQQEAVRTLLKSLHNGGAGLRMWISRIAARSTPAPAHVPARVIQTYLDNPEALPLFECEECGLPIPVRPNRCGTYEDNPEHIFWARCPVCEARTGWPKFRAVRETVDLRRRRPR